MILAGRAFMVYEIGRKYRHFVSFQLCSIITIMNYIVLDLEWNQGSALTENPDIPFEILEIGAVKLNENKEIVDSYDRFICPVVYKKIHFMTQKIIRISMKDLEAEEPFPAVMDDFLKWCGEPVIFCTWGSLDLTQLQFNMKFHGMEPLSNGPIEYLDVQKLFSLYYEDGKSRRSLEHAVEVLDISKTGDFHQADSDARYTAIIFQSIKDAALDKRYSYDVFNKPADKSQEIYTVFEDYSKYISREFDNKALALRDKDVTRCICFKCSHTAKRRINWFSLNNKHYYCLAYCRTHGYLRGKIRIKKEDNGKIYIVKTIKSIKREDVENLYVQDEKSKLKKTVSPDMPGRPYSKSRNRRIRKNTGAHVS